MLKTFARDINAFQVRPIHDVGRRCTTQAAVNTAVLIRSTLRRRERERSRALRWCWPVAVPLCPASVPVASCPTPGSAATARAARQGAQRPVGWRNRQLGGGHRPSAPPIAWFGSAGLAAPGSPSRAGAEERRLLPRRAGAAAPVPEPGDSRAPPRRPRSGSGWRRSPEGPPSGPAGMTCSGGCSRSTASRAPVAVDFCSTRPIERTHQSARLLICPKHV